MEQVHQTTTQNQDAINIRGEKYRARVRELNDAFRKNPERGLGVSGRVLVTKGVAALGTSEMYAVLERVKAFNDFTDDNDSWGEHDFGAFDHKDERIYWKIDYYDRDEHGASPNPADPSVTFRVMTVMLASEY